MFAALLLAGALAAYFWYLWGGRKRLGPGRRRSGNRFARTAQRMLVVFGGVGLACLLLLDRGGALVAMPAEFVPVQRLAARLTGLPAPERWPVGFFVLSMLGGGVLAGLLARYRRRAPMTLGKVDAITPRTWGDLGWAMLLSVDAGVCEELFFRLVLPLLFALMGAGAVVGFGVSAALFGLAHRYQGIVGVLTTAVVALLLTAAYLLTGQLWVAMALHAALDVTGLVVRPVVAGMVRR